MYLNGELLVGEKNETHTQVIQEYIDSFDEDDDFYRMDEEQLMKWDLMMLFLLIC